MPPHEQQPAPVAPAAPADSQRPPILDVVVKGTNEEYIGRYVLTEEVYNGAPVWQQLGGGRRINYAALGSDPAKVKRWMLSRPPLPSETEYTWYCDLKAAEGCSASTPPQSAGAWVTGRASPAPASVRISVPDQEIAAARRAAAAQLESELAARETAEAALAAERRRSEAAQAEKGAAERALEEETRRAAAAQEEEQRRAAAALAEERRRAAAALSAKQDAELQLRREAEGRRAEEAKRLTAEEAAARRALELEGAGALADLLLGSQTVAATISAAERAGRLKREAELRLAEAATQLSAEEAAGRQQVHAAAFEGFCDQHQRWAGMGARAEERRRSAHWQLSATAVAEAEQRRAVEAQCLADLAAVFLGSQTVAATISAAERAGRLEREAELRLAEAAAQLSAEEAAGRQQVHAAAFESFCDLLQRWAGVGALAAERQRSAQGQLSAMAVAAAEQRRAVEVQCLAELAAVFREAAACTASAERRAGGREALAVAEADARAAAEAEQRAMRTEAMRGWEQRAARLHRAAAAEELRRVSAAADAERKRAAAAERAAALAEERARGAEQQAAEARRAASQAEEALRAAEVQHRVAAAAAEGRRAAEAEALLRAAAAARQRSDDDYTALLREIEQIGGGGRRQRSPAAAAGPAAPPPHGHAAGGARATQGASRRSATAVLPPAAGRSRTTTASGAAERCRTTVSTPDAVRDSVGDVLRSFFSASEELRALGRWEVAKVRRKGKGPQWRLILPCDLSPEAEAALTAAWTRRFRVDGRFIIVTPSVLAAEAAAAPLLQTRSHSAPPHCRVTRSDGDGDGDAGAGGRPVAWETDASSLYESAL